MPKGKRSAVGDRTVNQNGYAYIKTSDRGWTAEHQLFAEENILGRRLLPGEYVEFVCEPEDRYPVTEEKIRVRRRGDHRSKVAARIAQIDARIEELQAERGHLLQEIGTEAVNA